MERDSVSDIQRDDIDLATAAEQSSEEDEAQEGNVLADEEESVQPAEEEAIHIEDAEEVGETEAEEEAEVDPYESFRADLKAQKLS